MEHKTKIRQGINNSSWFQTYPHANWNWESRSSDVLNQRNRFITINLPMRLTYKIQTSKNYGLYQGLCFWTNYWIRWASAKYIHKYLAPAQASSCKQIGVLMGQGSLSLTHIELDLCNISGLWDVCGINFLNQRLNGPALSRIFLKAQLGWFNTMGHVSVSINRVDLTWPDFLPCSLYRCLTIRPYN